MTIARFIIAAALAGGIAASLSAADPVKTSAQGIYTEAQAAEGAELYQGSCAACHGVALGGSMETPPLNGKWVANWAGKPMSHVVDYISHAMPLYAPGSLSPEDNAKIVAYLLKANAMPAGSVALPSDPAALDKLRFDVAKRYEPKP
ncbi:c-type cytochrome [Sphingomonas crocodyli]|nr:cytochrome c [Sphingomonas crocodyli]